MINTRIVKLVAQRILHRCLLFRLVLASDGTKSGGRRTLRLFQRQVEPLPIQRKSSSPITGWRNFSPLLLTLLRELREFIISDVEISYERWKGNEIFQTFWTMKVSKYTYRRTLLSRYLERIGQEVSGIYNFVV